jgi:hypothetical protein
MINEKLLDRMNFTELSQSLDHVLERIGRIEDGTSAEELVLDMLYVLANKIVMRMDSLVRENSHSNPQALAQWRKVMSGYEERFDKYTDSFLEEELLLDTE